jgi:hypothetical protein
MLYRVDWNGSDRLSFNANLDGLTSLVKQSHEAGTPIRLVVFDPMPDFAGVDRYKDDEVRPALATLKAWAEEHQIAIKGLMHPNKKNEQSAVQRTGGAGGWVAFPRINNLVGTTADGVRAISSQKTNIYKKVSVSFRIIGATVTADGVTLHDVAKVEWIKDAAHIDADDLLGAKKQEQVKVKREEQNVSYLAIKWLADRITGDEPTPTSEFLEEWKSTFNLSRDKADRYSTQAGTIKTKTSTLPARSLWRIPPFMEGLAN